ncbi:PREDICTED: protein trichome birefringence-like 3 [Tarenaya hassleriana]|uniref:protein trichome birefringence-like 3 n=1 Tax=Tarenaya hassleriana TaxID=28532 RepID=UPI00053C2CB9|nr:PREDICTED: protein trichome birefringence-like 3 [Tarenaya hassleriana]XP_010553107.1 PREDICTED: protein trichome birefringence-like 3 [Tarenaya hassleriana]XP_010553108.1 PREDICTED: protein trichome birefringence-like 3 [Tarenaya hassleriana]XP_010553109.1 PREDICTED: protein trichome birefringence-like 3 [Tarenaya hassleriana]XP_010553110.1 PREDICTED: protein trichome birefringence-like 3 [Tarenaya hassleriana]XP_010553111.1 PREDICTED: protein trichome birefringence-like 3 [Tarenaya hassle
MASYRGTKVPLSAFILVLCGLLFFLLLYTERISLISSSSSSSSSSSIFKFKTCARKRSTGSISKEKLEDEETTVDPELVDDRFEFDEECDVTVGKWVYNRSIEPLYTDESCPYIDRQFSCVKNGRPETDYLRWEWRPDDCTLPRFSPELALNKLRGKTLLFAGDSLQRSQWESFVCLVNSVIPEGQKSMKRGKRHSVFRAKEYNASIEFYWAPFIVESNTDQPVIADPKKRIVKVDSLEERSKRWEGADILVFNTYVWWMSGLKVKALWGSFPNGEEGAEALDTPVAYRLGLKTWANWVDSTVDPNKTRVFFTTMSPTHTRSADWGKPNGTKCYNETEPIRKRRFWGSGSNKAMMGVVSGVVKRMKSHVTFLNITQLSEYRIDAHASVYTETGGKILTAEERADPMRHADCIHWCLPGLPDTWNQILLAHL